MNKFSKLGLTKSKLNRTDSKSPKISTAVKEKQQSLEHNLKEISKKYSNKISDMRADFMGDKVYDTIKGKKFTKDPISSFRSYIKKSLTFNWDAFEELVSESFKARQLDMDNKRQKDINKEDKKFSIVMIVVAGIFITLFATLDSFFKLSTFVIYILGALSSISIIILALHIYITSYARTMISELIATYIQDITKLVAETSRFAVKTLAPDKIKCVLIFFKMLKCVASFPRILIKHLFNIITNTAKYSEIFLDDKITKCFNPFYKTCYKSNIESAVADAVLHQYTNDTEHAATAAPRTL